MAGGDVAVSSRSITAWGSAVTVVCSGGALQGSPAQIPQAAECGPGFELHYKSRYESVKSQRDVCMHALASGEVVHLRHSWRSRDNETHVMCDDAERDLPAYSRDRRPRMGASLKKKASTLCTTKRWPSTARQHAAAMQRLGLCPVRHQPARCEVRGCPMWPPRG